ncbi:hypothetical protein V8C35DRAFT_83646 [Trichoderma chlorosporum]
MNKMFLSSISGGCPTSHIRASWTYQTGTDSCPASTWISSKYEERKKGKGKVRLVLLILRGSTLASKLPICATCRQKVRTYRTSRGGGRLILIFPSTEDKGPRSERPGVTSSMKSVKHNVAAFRGPSLVWMSNQKDLGRKYRYITGTGERKIQVWVQHLCTITNHSG